MTLPRPATPEQRMQFLRYTDPARWPVLGRFPVGPAVLDEVLAAMIAGTADDVRTARAALTLERGRRVATLLAEDGFRRTVQRLPFTAADRVVAIGDSITADRLGWFELLAAAVPATGDGGPTMVNAAASGNTTADVIERFDLVEAARPTHALLMLGTNDARGHGRRQRQPMATPGETARNLRVLSDLLTRELGCGLTVLTPPTCDPARTTPFFADLPLGWRRSDLDAVADAIRRLGAPYVDVHAFTAAGRPGDLFDDDGVHLSAAGQVDVARFVVDRLAAGTDGSVARQSAAARRW